MIMLYLYFELFILMIFYVEHYTNMNIVVYILIMIFFDLF